MNRAFRLMVLTGITSASVTATALITNIAEAAPSSNAAQHANAHSAVAAAASDSTDTSGAAGTSSAPAAPSAGSVTSTEFPGADSPAHQIYTDPQPASNADFSGNGANEHGPYDSTRDGSPSMNGNGGGEAVGKPCAGCVGKADNKNPQGQQPGGSDHNNGYECDGNHGIGRSNPAHTGCVPQIPTPSVGTPTPPVTTPPTTSTPDVPSGTPSVDRPTRGEILVNPPAPPASPSATPIEEVDSAVFVAESTKDLAHTGAEIRNGIVAGLASLVLGLGLIAANRRKDTVS